MNKILTLSIIIIFFNGCTEKHSNNNKIDENIEIKSDTTIKKHYKSGNLKSVMHYEGNEAHGPAFVYFDRGDTVLSKDNGEYYKYFLPAIRKYSFINSLGKISFEWVYNEKREVTESFGKTIVEYWAPEKVEENSELVILALVPYPPFSEGDLKIHFALDGVTSSHMIEINEPYIRFDTVITKSGNYDITMTSIIESRYSDLKMVDSVTFALRVNQ